jgi:hypothetical protein
MRTNGFNKEFVPVESKKCTIDNIHPNWENQFLLEDLDAASQNMFGVDYDDLGQLGKLEVEDFVTSNINNK